MALTATADRLTRSDIIAQLHLNDPYCSSVIVRPPEHIPLSVYANPGARQRNQFIVRLAQKYPQDSGIVYCLSPAKAPRKPHGGAVRARSACRVTMPACRLTHATLPCAPSLPGVPRWVCHCRFRHGHRQKAISGVVHVNMPGNIESYYQEIGLPGATDCQPRPCCSIRFRM